MKVKELRELLKGMAPEQDVLCYTEDEELIPKGHGFGIFEINTVSEAEVEPTRGADQIPSLKLRKTDHSRKHVIVEITSDM